MFVVKWGDRLSFRFRIVTGFLIFLACIVALPFISVEWVTLTIVCILGFSDAIVQGSIYGLSGQFHPRCRCRAGALLNPRTHTYTTLLRAVIGAVMAGNGIAGLSVSLLRVMTKLVIPGETHHDNEMSAVLYFSLSAFVIILSIVVYVWVLEVRAHAHCRC